MAALPLPIRDGLVTPCSRIPPRRFPPDAAAKHQRNQEEIGMTDIVHRVGIRSPAAQVYKALSTVDGLAGWWTKATSGNSTRGGMIEFRFHNEAGDEIGGFAMEVLELVPDQRVVWRVKAGPPEWIGTEVAFDLYRQEGYTIVRFAHRNWQEETEFTAHCSTKWGTFLLSLRDLVETGKGQPAPDDLRISDWH
jgi:uncharacterized protein YndB with AHSA1/START domain